MLIYDLICSQGHHFEGWFRDLKDLKNQLKQNFLVCPVCGDGQIGRRPSTFGMVKKRAPQPEPPSAPAAAEKNAALLKEEKLREFLQQLEVLSQKLQTEFDDVGTEFTARALKMHYGVEPRRNIRGSSTEEQEDMLRKEGVQFFKAPMLARKSQGSAAKKSH